MVYYSGHGKLRHGTQRVTLHGELGFALETKIRNFKNEHSKNAYAWAIFDSCRNVSPDANVTDIVQGEEHQEFQEVHQGDSNMVIVYSSEPTKYTLTRHRITHALFEWIENKKIKPAK